MEFSDTRMKEALSKVIALPKGGLILTRKTESEILIVTADGSPIVLKISEVREDGRVRLYFRAEPDVMFLRMELASKIARELEPGTASV